MRVSLYFNAAGFFALAEVAKSAQAYERIPKLVEGLHKAAEEFNGIECAYEMPLMDDRGYSSFGKKGFGRADFRKVDSRMLKMKNASRHGQIFGRR